MDLPRLVRDLKRRKARERRGLVLAEGVRLVEDALSAGAALSGVVASVAAAKTAGGRRLLGEAAKRAVPTAVVPGRDFDALADTETPSGVLAVVEWTPLTLDRLPAAGSRPVALVLDAVQDPGNVGTMIRTAHALGAWCTIALDGTADVRSPKVIRGAMGSTFRHPVAEASFDEFVAFARARQLEVYVAAAGAPPSPLAPRTASLVIGSEGHGARAAWSGVPHRRVAVPMPGDAESLNAAVAAGILLYELTRVR